MNHLDVRSASPAEKIAHWDRFVAALREQISNGLAWHLECKRAERSAPRLEPKNTPSNLYRLPRAAHTYEEDEARRMALAALVFGQEAA